MKEAIKETTVVIASSENNAVFDCIDSVDGDAQVVVSLTPFEPIEERLLKLKIPFVKVPRGNLGATFNAGLEIAPTNKVIIMTDDSTFNPGSIDRLSEGLEIYDACKPRIIFESDDDIPFSRAVAGVRDFINSSPTRAFTPGLAINKDIRDKMGGHFFDEEVRWGEDAEFSYRFHRNDLIFGYIADASINHPATSLQHDLKGAFLIGVGKRRSVEMGIREGNENVLRTLQRLLSGKSLRERKRLLNEKGVASLAYKVIWDAAYNTGYYLQRIGAADGVEQLIWSDFGKNKERRTNE